MAGKTAVFGLITAIIAVFFTTGCGDKSPSGLNYSLKSDEQRYFLEADRDAFKFKPDLKNVHAGICSHHLFMVKYIAGYFRSLKSSSSDIKTFVIIGPNHYSRGRADVSVTDYKWKTPFGYLEREPVLIAKLVDNGYAEIDHDAFTFEHSIGAIVPFIKQYFPDSKIVPVLLKHGLTCEKAAELGKFLSSESGDSTFVLLSADFVHNKKNRDIKPIDNFSKEVLINYKSYNSCSGLPILEMDCNLGLQILMSYAYQRSYTTRVLLNTNSAVISGKDIPATSYFFVFFGH